ncbi:hypothetical protein VPH35_066640 [Triticum aestivum]|uniref:Uncharacterized protein n=1 Tax=Triticum turgidum subsp. durum TaxID=4567 RepID=A0A9R0VZW4_TRITD|nr:abscisic stress-ripening protein 5-like [Triticum aestivum]VAH93445.1 unnamed protein product [Triticum turgidum subsp. durum]
MSEEKHHHLFHHKEGEDFQPAADGGVDTYGYSTETVVTATGNDGEYERITKEEKHHKHKEHLGEMGAAAAGAFALYEKHEAKKDPEHAHKHKIEEEVAAAAAVGAGGFVFHEHHEKKQDHKEAKEASGEKKHHHFG